MSLFKIMAKEDEEILEEKIIKIHQKAKKELLPYLKAYLWSQGLSEDDKAIVEDENLVDIKIGKAGTGETKFLTVNASSLEPKPKPNQNQNNKNLKQQNKREEITDFIGDAITSTLSAMKRAQIAINQKNYADALEYSTLIHESLGCIKVANKLNFFN
ncbi:MAG: hypothetical protein JWR60_4186, partial [Polaromonas sp.]|nr:hypothetical protein [Polaromonas sp.]